MNRYAKASALHIYKLYIIVICSINALKNIVEHFSRFALMKKRKKLCKMKHIK